MPVSTADRSFLRHIMEDAAWTLSTTHKTHESITPRMLKEQTMTLEIGDTAPAFNLPHQPGQTINLADYLGQKKIVLLFFPFSFSPVCTAEMCAMRDSWAQWENLDAEVFAITVDSPFVTDKFRKEENIPFPVLSDFNKVVATEYGVLYEEFHGLKGVPKRSAFVIGTDGRIHYAWSSDDSSVQPDYETVKNALIAAP